MKVQTRFGEMEIETYEKDGCNVISHTVLAKLLNQFKTECKLIEDYAPLSEQFLDTEHGIYVVTRDIRDPENGVVYRGIGEVNPNNIESDIARKNPVVMAFNRALDKAFIDFLGCEKKFYSSIEFADSSNSNSGTADNQGTQKKTQSKKTAPTPPPVAPGVPETPVQKPMPVSYDVTKSKAETVQAAEAPATTPVTPAAAPIKDESPFVENEPVINPVTGTAAPVSNMGPLEPVPVQSEPEETPVMPEPVTENVPEQVSMPESETPAAPETVPEPTAPETEPEPDAKDPGEYIIPAGRIAGKKLKEADEAFLAWLGDVTKYGNIPPRYSQEFIDAFKAFMASR